MDTLRRISVPFGVTGGVWALIYSGWTVAALLRAGSAGFEVRLDWFVQMGSIAMMAVFAFGAILLRSKTRRLALALLWTRAAGMTLASFLPRVPGLGLPAFPAAILLVLSAAGSSMSPRVSVVPQQETERRRRVGVRKAPVVLGLAGAAIATAGTIFMASTLRPGVREAITFVYFGIAGMMALVGLVAVVLVIAHSRAAKPLMWVSAVGVGLAGLSSRTPSHLA